MKLQLQRRHSRRQGDRKFGPIAYLRRFAHELTALGVAGAALWGGVTYFASAADVEKKFEMLDRKIEVSAYEERKYRIENELFRLRSANGRNPSVRAQIQRYEADLQSVDARLRDLTNDERDRRRR